MTATLTRKPATSDYERLLESVDLDALAEELDEIPRETCSIHSVPDARGICADSRRSARTGPGGRRRSGLASFHPPGLPA